MIRLLFLILTMLCIAPFQSQGANYALEIIQPRSGLSTTNRFYKAYPGLEYNVRMAVIGGAYPFTYSLTTAPSGMSIDASTGVITWSNPTTSGSPHSITAKVVDAEASEQTVSWTLTVTTTGFKFLDSVNGLTVANGGTGTLANPWKHLADMYEGTDGASEDANSYAGEFLYFRNGSYPSDNVYVEGSYYMPFNDGNKPLVWLAYPGESPILDIVNTLYFESGADNLYLDGFRINLGNSTRKMGLRITSGASNVTIRRNVFDGEGMVATIGGNNSLVFIEHGGEGSRWALQDNTGQDVSGEGGYWLIGYTASRVLVENNHISNILSHPIGPKEGTNMWFIRGNHVENPSQNGINVQYSNAHGINSGNIEISYNYVNVPEGYGPVFINSNETTQGDPIYIYRNTIVGDVRAYTVESTNGSFSFYNNVIVNDASGTKITTRDINYPANLIIADNLLGTANVVDEDGLLLPAYSSSLGVAGWQFADGTTPLDGSYNPPSGAYTPIGAGTTAIGAGTTAITVQ